jgi:hypothetical protein
MYLMQIEPADVGPEEEEEAEQEEAAYSPSNEAEMPSNEADMPSYEADMPSNEADMPSNETEIPWNETEISAQGGQPEAETEEEGEAEKEEQGHAEKEEQGEAEEDREHAFKEQQQLDRYLHSKFGAAMREEGGGRIEELAEEAAKAGARRKLLSLSQDPPVRFFSAHPALLFWGLRCQCWLGFDNYA